MGWLGVAVYAVVAVCGVAAAQHWRHEQIPIWEGMGLRFEARAWTDLAGGVAIGGLVMGGIFGVEWALGAVAVNGVLPPDLRFATTLIQLAISALGEEILFRSLVLGGLVVMLRKRWLAVVVMATLFGLAHAGNPDASALSVLGNALGGLMYAVAFLGSGCIWLPTGLHFAWNFFQGPVLGFPVSGLDMGGLVQQSAVGSDLVTGGSYGPEAGLVGMAFRFVVIALVAGWLSLRRQTADSSTGQVWRPAAKRQAGRPGVSGPVKASGGERYMTERHVGGRASGRWETIFHQYLLPAAGSSLGVAYATGRWDLSAVATGLIITGTLALVWKLGRAFVQPRLTRVTQDWLRLGLEMGASVAGHLVGAFLGLFVGGLIFDFEIGAVVMWVVVGSIAVAAPIIHGTETALGYYRQLKEKERLEEQLRALATQAELKALKAQINPHFLFNTLNTIAQLTHTDPAQAEAMIERLAEMLRYVLAGSERGLVPLAEELAFVDNYLEIEQARFSERLRVTREVAPEALRTPVPSLILQPLVENAIRHGQGSDGSIDLTLRVQRHDDAVVIAIADQGPGMPPGRQLKEGHGHGLRNVDARLRKMYGCGLEIRDNAPRGTVATVRVPLVGEV